MTSFSYNDFVSIFKNVHISLDKKYSEIIKYFSSESAAIIKKEFLDIILEEEERQEKNNALIVLLCIYKSKGGSDKELLDILVNDVKTKFSQNQINLLIEKIFINRVPLSEETLMNLTKRFYADHQSMAEQANEIKNFIQDKNNDLTRLYLFINLLYINLSIEHSCITIIVLNDIFPEIEKILDRNTNNIFGEKLISKYKEFKKFLNEKYNDDNEIKISRTKYQLQKIINAFQSSSPKLFPTKKEIIDVLDAVEQLSRTSGINKKNEKEILLSLINIYKELDKESINYNNNENRNISTEKINTTISKLKKIRLSKKLNKSKVNKILNEYEDISKSYNFTKDHGTIVLNELKLISENLKNNSIKSSNLHKIIIISAIVVGVICLIVILKMFVF